MESIRGQTALEYLLILAGIIVLVAVVAVLTQNAMAPGINATNNQFQPTLWAKP
ncbi:MAG: class III signal peptide-containing protein [Candidatus Micrarchaeia archaeon]|jgi:uncharacterized protein (UPF0333 family)